MFCDLCKMTERMKWACAIEARFPQRACYLHDCLKHVNSELMTNASLRERFAISAKNSSMISRLLNETCESGLIKISQDSTSDKNSVGTLPA